MTTTYPFRQVVRSEFIQSRYSPPGHGSYQFTLECGHVEFAKASYGVPRFKRCRECGQAQTGTVSR